MPRSRSSSLFTASIAPGWNYWNAQPNPTSVATECCYSICETMEIVKIPTQRLESMKAWTFVAHKNLCRNRHRDAHRRFGAFPWGHRPQYWVLNVVVVFHRLCPTVH